MEEIKPGWFYIAADGDGIGKLVGRAVIANDVEELHKVSNRIDAAQDLILHWCKDNGGVKISGGGDEFTAAIPPEAKDSLKDLRASIESSFGYTISVGVGRSLSEAGTALLVAKLRGKDRIVYFNKYIKDDIKKAKRRVREKRATPDEYKLSEAYLKKGENMLCNLHKKEHHMAHIHNLHKHEEGYSNAPEVTEEDKLPFNPDAEDNRTDDCAYCQDLDAEENANGTAGMHECDMCRHYDASQQNTGGIELDDCPYCQDNALDSSHPDDCEMCDEYDAAQGTKDIENYEGGQDHPETFEGADHICNCPYCNANKKESPGETEVNHPDHCPECQKMYDEAIENQPDQTGQVDPKMQGHETAEEVLDLLDQEPGSGEQTPTEEAKKIDNTELPQGDQMKENKSVREDFGDAQKGDISDSEQDFGQEDDGPDMTSVLQSGLDDHANEQKRQEVLNMVAQTLQGFKANKESLEATKDQNQALYQSCIQMLKSMIELCKLLGLEPKMPEAPAAPTPEETAPEEQNSPQAAPQEGAAEAPKAQAG